MTTPQSPVFRILRLLKVTGCPAGSRWAWNAGGPSSAHSSRGAAAGQGKATLDLGPNEVRTEQPGCYVVRQLSLYLCNGDMSWPMAVWKRRVQGPRRRRVPRHYVPSGSTSALKP